MASKRTTDDRLVKADPIRLSADESRMILKAHRAAPKPVEIWGHQGNSLVDLGLMKIVRIPDASIRMDESAGWKQLRAGVKAKDLAVTLRGMERVRSAKSRAGKRGIVLTALGSAIARGLTVRLSRSA